MGIRTDVIYSTLSAKYGVTREIMPGCFYDVSFLDLQRPEEALAFAGAFAPSIKALSIDVAGTYFASWLSRLCGAFQETLFLYSAVLPLHPEKVRLQMAVAGERFELAFCVKDTDVAPLPEGEARNSVAEQAMDAFYGMTVRPVVDAVAAAVNVPSRTLWALIATSLKYAGDHLEEQELPEPARERYRHDFAYLMKEMPGTVTGTGARNPFDIRFRYVASPYEPGKKTIVRAACCLAYKTDSGHGYCYNCPKLSREEREKRCREIQANQANQVNQANQAKASSP